jgi:hypothetical protein
MKNTGVVDPFLEICISFHIDKSADVYFVHPQLIEVVQDEYYPQDHATHTIQSDHQGSVVERVDSLPRLERMKIGYRQH